MIRIEMSQLVVVEDKYFFRDAPFSGIGYARGEQREIRTFSIEEGTVVGKYVPICAEGASGYMQIDVTGLLADEPNAAYPLDFGDGRFTGIGYGFQDGYCIYEMLFIDGAVRCDSWWNKVGMLFCYNRFGHLEEHYRWFDSGQIELASVSTPSLRIIFNFLEDGALQSLIIEGEVLSRLPEFGRLEHFPIKTFDDFGTLRGGPRVFLARKGINDNLLHLMAQAGVFAKTPSLKLHETAVTTRSLGPLSQVVSLNTIVIQSNSEQQRELASELKKRRPDLVVEYKPERVFRAVE